MTAQFQAGAVLYAKNLARVQAFYCGVLGLDAVHAEPDHVVLASPVFQLVLVRPAPPIAMSIVIENPPRLRSETSIKLVFAVASLSVARMVAAQYGGALLPPEREWDFQDYRVCDGHDPEGNVLQFRQARGEHA